MATTQTSGGGSTLPENPANLYQSMIQTKGGVPPAMNTPVVSSFPYINQSPAPTQPNMTPMGTPPTTPTPEPTNSFIPQASADATADTTATTPTGDTNISNSQEITNLYNMGKAGVEGQISDIANQYTNAVKAFDKGDIVDKMRLKTGGVADLDQAISGLSSAYNRSTGELMAKYAHIIDPVKRNALISQEQGGIAKQISDLQAIRQYRLGAIKDMTDAEIARGEQKLKALEAQYNVARDVMGDIREQDKIESEMQKTALAIQEAQMKNMKTMDELGFEIKKGTTSYGATDLTDLQNLYPNNASFKNNNPGNIKFNPNGFNKTLDQYGIGYSVGTPATDGGNFLKFNSIEDALQARQILLFKTGTYPNMTVDSAMRRYSNNGYGAEISSVPGNKLMKDLTTEEKRKIVMGQLKGEDGAMFNEIVKRGIDPMKTVTQDQIVKKEKTDTEGFDTSNLPEKYDDFVRTQAGDIKKLLLEASPSDIQSEIGSLYPGESKIMQTIGRTLTKSDKENVIMNAVTRDGITDNKDSLDKLFNTIDEYYELFYPDAGASKEEKGNNEYELGITILDTMKAGKSKIFGKKLREAFEEEFE